MGNVIDALDGGAANLLGSVSAPAIYAFVEAALGAWDQRPLFKAHVSKVIELRCCTPVRISDLRGKRSRCLTESVDVNAVFRWEWRLGSTLYFVWTQNRVDLSNPGRLSLGRDSRRLVTAPADDILLVKFAYWFGR